ncbi:energy transducer TonB [uncultured Croceitalea sp.]|uniref:energy transducer TonB n=1 Tax=uncultured Croceitalea sp. TaxID=1798908 RepID=UPI0033059EFA
MEAKKKEHLRLEKNSSLYFVIGMALVLALIYTALEWKTFDSNTDYTSQLDPPDVLEPEIPPITINMPPPPPPKIQVPVDFDIKEDDEDVVEDVIESNDVDQDTEVMEPQSFDFIKEEVEPKVTWVTIEEAPVFPGCENASDKRACFSEMMQKHIRKNFRYPQQAIDMGLQGKVYLQFTVKTDGSIGNLEMRGPHSILEQEAYRIITKLPKMEPGQQRGKAVKVPFSIPITFQLQ